MAGVDPNLILPNRLRDKPQKDYRALSGMSKGGKNPQQPEGIGREEQDLFSVHVDPNMEREFFDGQDPLSQDELDEEEAEELLDYVDDVDENLSTEQILALAQEEEQRIRALEQEQNRREQELQRLRDEEKRKRDRE